MNTVLDAPPAEATTPAACLALERLGDVAALVDRRSRRLCWTSSAWQALQPLGPPAVDAQALPAEDPALAAALEAAERAMLAGGDSEAGSARHGTAAAPLRLGDGGPWEASVVALGPRHLLLRLADRREQSRALQRQLDDRERLLFTSRVFSVGEMATTLAHELNQPIGAAANLLRGLRTRLARRRAVLADEESAALDRTLEQVMFAARVIQRIREFTHSHQPRHRSLDLAALLQASASLLDWDLRRTGARLVIERPEGPVPVRGDEVMLQQVLVNLMRNALDAMRADPPAEPTLVLSLERRGHEAELRVRDNGCGLGDDAAARLFVPFTSSKPNGMGIGLAICRSFVELHQGRLWYSRNDDRGATFHVGLPLQAARPPARTA